MKTPLSICTILFLSFPLSLILLLINPASGYSADTVSNIGTKDVALSENVSCSNLIELLTRQQQNTSRELHQIKRDIAALNQKLEKPGIKDIVAGVGFILGLFGIGALIISRGNKKDSKS